MKVVIILVASLLFSVCNAANGPRLYYNYLQVANLTGNTISNLELKVGERDLRCDTVTNNGICDERFGKRPYPQQSMQLSWKDGDGKQQTQQLNPSIPATMSPGTALQLLLEIHKDGSVKADFQQDGFRS
jgi:hypothetical protein